MRRANVYCRGVLAGVLTKHERGYRFQYVPEYLRRSDCPAISLSLPKREAAHESAALFPFFSACSPRETTRPFNAAC